MDDVYYDLSTHFVWVGEWTSKYTEAHVEFFRGIENPIGMKVGPKKPISEVIEAIKSLNPNNAMGKLVLILRMGSLTRELLPELVSLVKDEGLNVVWVSDPMHGNTYATS